MMKIIAMIIKKKKTLQKREVERLGHKFMIVRKKSNFKMNQSKSLKLKNLR